MKDNIALIFGDNDYTFEIEKNIKSEYKEVYIFKLDEEAENSFDLSDNWDILSATVDIKVCSAFCILEDMAENIFLTLSLRDTFRELIIIALSQNKESDDKLILAGATNILPTIQTTANFIVDILEKPVVTKVLQDILYEKNSLKITQLTIEDDSIFEGKYPTSIEWSRDHGIIIISLVHADNTRDFIYTSKVKNHKIEKGDIFVVMAYEKDITNFEKLIGTKNEN